MRRTAIAIIAITLVAAAGVAQTPPFRTSRERISYALGVQAGQQFKSRGIDLDPGAFGRGLRDSYSGTAPALTDEQVAAAIAELQAEQKRRQLELRSGAAADARRTAEAFLAENAKKPGVVTLPSGLQYRVLSAGTGPKPTAADTVECSFRGTLANGMEFVASGSGGVGGTVRLSDTIAGLREALLMMPVGSKWEVAVPPALAAGPRQTMSSIPPNQALVYEIQLIAIR